MTSARLWILLLAVVSFLAGVAAGVLVAPGLTPVVDPGPFAHYERRFDETFDLSPEERSDLRHVLDRYRREIQELEARHAQDLEDERVRIGQACRERIEKYVLADRPERIDLFRRMSAGATSSTDPVAR